MGEGLTVVRTGTLRTTVSADRVLADVVDEVVDALYGVSLYLAVTAESTESTVGTRLNDAVREVDSVVQTLRRASSCARAASTTVDIDDVVAAMAFVDRSVERLAMLAPIESDLTSSLVDAGHAVRWAVHSLDDVRRCSRGAGLRGRS